MINKNGLSDAEKELINKLGLDKLIKGISTFKATAKKVIPKQEYNLIGEITCLTCGYIHYHYYIMKWDETRTLLYSVPVSNHLKLILLNETRTTKSTSERCSHCQEVLNNMTKEELIQRIFKIYARMGSK
jgi:hypothetical protein